MVLRLNWVVFIGIVHLYEAKNDLFRRRVTDRLELLAKLLVEIRRLLQSGLQGSDLLFLNLQR